MNTPTVIIEIRNGSVTGIVADRAMNAVVVEHNILGHNHLRDVPCQ